MILYKYFLLFLSEMFGAGSGNSRAEALCRKSNKVSTDTDGNQQF